MTLSIFPCHKKLFVLIDVLTPCRLEKLAFGGGGGGGTYFKSLWHHSFFFLAPIFASTVYRIFHIQSFCCANNGRCPKERLHDFLYVVSFLFYLISVLFLLLASIKLKISLCHVEEKKQPSSFCYCQSKHGRLIHKGVVQYECTDDKAMTLSLKIVAVEKTPFRDFRSQSSGPWEETVRMELPASQWNRNRILMTRSGVCGREFN